MKDKRLEHIKNVIQPWDENQFIRTCYLNLNWDEWMVTNKMFNEYIERIREQAFKNWYAEEDLQKIMEPQQKMQEFKERPQTVSLKKIQSKKIK